jgi:hypothetical protein
MVFFRLKFSTLREAKYYGFYCLFDNYFCRSLVGPSSLGGILLGVAGKASYWF